MIGDMTNAFHRLLLVTRAQARRFPNGLDPFKMVTRLAEECGEVAVEVQRFEGEGLKVEKLGSPDGEKMAKEVLDVMTAALTIAVHYDLVDTLLARLESSIGRAVSDGHLTPEEVASIT
jgi:NTP pyrophosphatase (non-canonical NTP hydrolase)